jgi:hypothetical protein
LCNGSWYTMFWRLPTLLTLLTYVRWTEYCDLIIENARNEQHKKKLLFMFHILREFYGHFQKIFVGAPALGRVTDAVSDYFPTAAYVKGCNRACRICIE